MDIERGGSNTEGVKMAAPNTSVHPLAPTPLAVAELDVRQVAIVSQCTNVETPQCMDRREAMWHAWCRKKGMDADPMVDKVREYLLDMWVDVGDDQKRRVSVKKP